MQLLETLHRIAVPADEMSHSAARRPVLDPAQKEDLREKTDCLSKIADRHLQAFDQVALQPARITHDWIPF